MYGWVRAGPAACGNRERSESLGAEYIDERHAITVVKPIDERYGRNTIALLHQALIVAMQKKSFTLLSCTVAAFRIEVDPLP
jgi:hypothetical protein